MIYFILDSLHWLGIKASENDLPSVKKRGLLSAILIRFASKSFRSPWALFNFPEHSQHLISLRPILKPFSGMLVRFHRSKGTNSIILLSLSWFFPPLQDLQYEFVRADALDIWSKTYARKSFRFDQMTPNQSSIMHLKASLPASSTGSYPPPG